MHTAFTHNIHCVVLCYVILLVKFCVICQSFSFIVCVLKYFILLNVSIQQQNYFVAFCTVIVTDVYEYPSGYYTGQSHKGDKL